ncbi:hypothetical protein B0H17DRAFT_1080937 [Mycena rosella]|uniref:Uncharacterized protein n=1 Tax=Mycena rosella TaxID=1033263 RepID=A0AAD7GC93_MYCRO|nr:hypothetical protein B0H17DRAFT_1080937 [Mycena rosella]
MNHPEFDIDESHHKFPLPDKHRLPTPQPESLDEYLETIGLQIFALCYNVEDFFRLITRKHPELDPVVWHFLHEVVDLLPRTLERKDIIEARINIFQSLYRTERDTSFDIVELVNPGAPIPEPLTVPGAESPEGSNTTIPIPMEFVHEGNPYTTERRFSITQNALVATEAVEYTVEFIPDEEDLDQPYLLIPGMAEALTLGPGPSKGKVALTKGKGKGKAAGKKAVAAPAKALAVKTAAKARAAKTAAKGKAVVRAPSGDDDDEEETADLTPPPPAPARARKNARHAAPPTTVPNPPSSSPPSPVARQKRGRAAAEDTDADESPPQKRVRRTADPTTSKKATNSKKKVVPSKVVVPPAAPVEGTRRSTRKKN